MLFSDPSVEIADPLLRRAYALAERGRGTTSPNPLVGCVIAADGVVVGEGFHERAGEPHAEVNALREAGERARGGHAAVTLEPCTHHGRTPPCVDALLAAGIESVTIGMADPNGSVSGGGAEALRAAGVQVSFADDSSAFEHQNEAWLHRLRTGRPFVRVKVALTIDGKPTLRRGHRSRITGEGGRAVTMQLRALVAGVAVGASTLAVDDCQLTVRDERGILIGGHTPVRYVIGRTSMPDPHHAIFRDGCALSTVVVSSGAASPEATAALEDRGVRVLTYPLADNLHGALTAIADDGCDDLLIEAGPSLLTALWGDGFIDELIVVNAGGMGGSAAPDAFLGSADADGLDLRLVMRAVEAGVVGGDAVTVWRPLEDDEHGSREGSV